MKFLTIKKNGGERKDGTKAARLYFQHKSKKFDELLSSKHIGNTKNILISGGFGSGKSRIIYRLWQERRNIWGANRGFVKLSGLATIAETTAETSRRLDRENQRRQTTATILGNFSEALARKNQALRMVSLYRSLEKRSQERVEQGLAETAEQIGFLEKTADAHSQLLRAKADVMKFRLQLVSLCTDQKASKLNNFLKRISGD